MTELKPCPFCGGEAITVITSRWLIGKYIEKSIFISCYCCGAKTKEKAREDEAIEAWNRRTE